MPSPRHGRFLVVGEALVDVVLPDGEPPTRAPGGSPLNVAVGLARLGVPTTLLTSVGDDADGRLIREHLDGSGVDLAPGSVHPGATSTATARLDGSGAASYDFDLRWDLAPLALPPGAESLHVGSLGTALRPGRTAVLDLIEQAVAAGLLVSFDPNARPTITPDAGRAWEDVLEVATRARVVKLSDEDLGFLQPGRSPSSLAADLLTSACELVVVTAGGGGAAGFSRHAEVELRSATVDVVDTVGAGDSFMAALLTVVVEHGLADLDERRLTAYLRAAHQAAAVTVSRRGADPPRRHELPAGWPLS